MSIDKIRQRLESEHAAFQQQQLDEDNALAMTRLGLETQEKVIKLARQYERDRLKSQFKTVDKKLTERERAEEKARQARKQGKPAEPLPAFNDNQIPVATDPAGVNPQASALPEVRGGPQPAAQAEGTFPLSTPEDFQRAGVRPGVDETVEPGDVATVTRQMGDAPVTTPGEIFEAAIRRRLGVPQRQIMQERFNVPTSNQIQALEQERRDRELSIESRSLAIQQTKSALLQNLQDDYNPQVSQKIFEALQAGNDAEAFRLQAQEVPRSARLKEAQTLAAENQNRAFIAQQHTENLRARRLELEIQKAEREGTLQKADFDRRMTNQELGLNSGLSPQETIGMLSAFSQVAGGEAGFDPALWGGTFDAMSFAVAENFQPDANDPYNRNFPVRNMDGDKPDSENPIGLWNTQASNALFSIVNDTNLDTKVRGAAAKKLREYGIVMRPQGDRFVLDEQNTRRGDNSLISLKVAAIGLRWAVREEKTGADPLRAQVIETLMAGKDLKELGFFQVPEIQALLGYLKGVSGSNIVGTIPKVPGFPVGAKQAIQAQGQLVAPTPGAQDRGMKNRARIRQRMQQNR